MTTDEQLVFGVGQGDDSCLGTLFERHHRTVFGFCARLLGDRAAAEDVSQDTFFKVMNKASSFAGNGSARGWILHIARNLCFDHMRRLGRIIHDDDLAEQACAAAVGAPDHKVDIEWQLDRLRQALMTLPETTRAVVLLGRFECDSYAELGTALGCSEGAARVRMHRAMKSLKAAYEVAEPTTTSRLPSKGQPS